MKKLIYLIMFAVALTQLSPNFNAKAETFTRPHVEKSSTSALYIDEVTVDKDATTILFHVYNKPQWWLLIGKDSYLKVGDKKLDVRSAEGITLGEQFFTDPKTSELTFSLQFPALPKGTTKFDFIEGEVEGAFRLEGIELTNSDSTSATNSTNANFNGDNQDKNAVKSQKFISSKETSVEDIIEILEDAGYENFSFDLSALSDKKYNIQLIIKEYEGGQLANTEILTSVRNITPISVFPPESQKRIIEEGSAADPERDIFKKLEKISLQLHPTKPDSLRKMYFSFEGMGKSAKELSLRRIQGKDASPFLYGARPIRLAEFTEREFYPLLMLGSFWFDDSHNVFRFCGETEVEPDLSGSLTAFSPHFYVIGIRAMPM